MRLFGQGAFVAGGKISVGTMQNWLARCTLVLHSPEPVGRGRRRYTEADIIRVAVMAELVVERGLNPSAAGEIVTEIAWERLGMVPAWMGRTRADHFLILADFRDSTTVSIKRVVESPAELQRLLEGTVFSDLESVQQSRYALSSATIINLSEMTRAVRDRMLDALAADHVEDQSDSEAGGETAHG